MTNLGALSEESGEPAEARRWYEQAAAGGHTGAMSALRNVDESS
jgi:hypothetical protein